MLHFDTFMILKYCSTTVSQLVLYLIQKLFSYQFAFSCLSSLLIATKTQRKREHISGRRFLIALARYYSFTNCLVSYCPQIFFDLLAACLPLGCYFAPISEGSTGVFRMICPPWSFTLLPQRFFQL